MNSFECISDNCEPIQSSFAFDTSYLKFASKYIGVIAIAVWLIMACNKYLKK